MRLLPGVLLALSSSVIAVVEPGPAGAAPVDPAIVDLDTYAWCGADPDKPDAAASIASMASVAGIDVTFGPCISPTLPYSPAFTGDRYADPVKYRKLVDMNAAAGMRTMVYDQRIWSNVPAVRDAALDFWAPVFAHIAGWDLGDEFDPDGPEWPILVARWQIVLGDATVRSGIRPFANHLYWSLNKALTDLPGSDQFTSFTRYAGDRGSDVAREFGPQVNDLMCGVNAFTHGPFTPSADSIRDDMAHLYAAGCSMFLIFGGHRVYGTDDFGDRSLTNPDGSPTTWATAVSDGSSQRDPTVGRYTPVAPARVLETRSGDGMTTIDGASLGQGVRPARSVTELTVAGRAGVPPDAEAVVLNVTVTEAQGAGFVTVFPCGSPRPNAATSTYAAGATVSTLVVAEVGVAGRVCLFVQEPTHLVVDVDGYHPVGTSYRAVGPARLLETRSGPGLATIDGQANGTGIREAGSVTELPVIGRAGVSAGTDAVVLNVTVTEAQGAGFVTLFPCGTSIPNTANLNHRAGDTVSNAVIAKVGANGAVCLYTSAAAHLVVDVSGAHPAGPTFTAALPARLLETRVGEGLGTVDGKANGIGRRGDDSVTELVVAGRGGVPPDAAAVVLNVTVTEPVRAGFVTVFACGSPRPNAANLTYAGGATAPNLVIAEVGVGGKVCLYTLAGAHLVVDVNAWFPGG